MMLLVIRTTFSEDDSDQGSMLTTCYLVETKFILNYVLDLIQQLLFFKCQAYSVKILMRHSHQKYCFLKCCIESFLETFYQFINFLKYLT